MAAQQRQMYLAISNTRVPTVAFVYVDVDPIGGPGAALAALALTVGATGFTLAPSGKPVLSSPDSKTLIWASSIQPDGVSQDVIREQFRLALVKLDSVDLSAAQSRL